MRQAQVALELKTEKEFKDFYESQLADRVEALELERQQLVKKYKTMMIVAGVVVLFSIIFKQMIGIILGVILASTYLPKIYKSDARKITNQLKEDLLPDLIAFVNESFTYEPKKRIHSGEVSRSRLFDPMFSRVKGDDLVSGEVWEKEQSDQNMERTYTSIKFSEIEGNFLYKTTDNEGRQTTSKQEVTRGLYYVIDFNKHFDGHVAIVPKKHRLPNVYSFKKDKQYHHINLESIDMMEQFDVYATDEITARYLLTSNSMERMVALAKETKHIDLTETMHERKGWKEEIKKGWQIGISRSHTGIVGYGVLPFFSLVDGKLYMYIPSNSVHFEQHLMTPVTHESFDRYFRDIHFAMQIVEELNLNLRIWTKK